MRTSRCSVSILSRRMTTARAAIPTRSSRIWYPRTAGICSRSARPRPIRRASIRSRSRPPVVRARRRAKARVACSACYRARHSEDGRGIAELLLLLTLATFASAQGRPCDPPTPLGPSHDLYCIELVPAPGVTGFSGRVELATPAGPFTVGVSAAGHARFIPIITLSGLPRTTHHARRTDSGYVAWAVTPQMDTVIRLGGDCPDDVPRIRATCVVRRAWQPEQGDSRAESRVASGA